MPPSVITLARQHRDQILALARRWGVSDIRVVVIDGPVAPDSDADAGAGLELVVAFDVDHHEGLDLFRFADAVEELIDCRVHVGTGLRDGGSGRREEVL